MKKFFALTAASLMMFCTSCSFNNSPTPKDYIDTAQDFISTSINENEAKMDAWEQTFKDNTVAVTDDATIEMPDTGKLKIKSYSVVQNPYTEQYELYITADYTNLSYRDSGYYDLLVYLDVYQDSVLISHTMGNLNRDDWTSIKPGATLEIVTSFALRNTTSAVEFECKDSYTDTVYGEYTLNIKK